MRFFRHRSSPALAALLAVAMQVAFLLAHAHVHSHTSGHQWAKNASLACRAMVPQAGCGPSVPHDHVDDCPLCWSLAASGAGVLPSPLVLAAPGTPMPAPQPPMSVPVLADAGASPFQARGPPRG